MPSSKAGSGIFGHYWPMGRAMFYRGRKSVGLLWAGTGDGKRITEGAPEPFAERVERFRQKALGEKGSRLFSIRCFWLNICPDSSQFIISILLGQTRENKDRPFKSSTRSANGPRGPSVIL